MLSHAMDLRRLEAIIAAYGARPERWPPAEREAAKALVARSAAARTLLDHAAALDRLLDAVPVMAPSAALRAAILAAAPPAPSLAGRVVEAWRRFGGEFGSFRMAGPVLAASLIIGIIIGGSLSSDADTASGPDLVGLALLDETYEGY